GARGNIWSRDGGQKVISGAKLKFARQARGYSQQQLAGVAGGSRQAVSAVESGQSDPSLRVAIALAQALGMTVEERVGAEGAIEAVSARVVGGDPGLGRPAGDRGARGALGARVTLAPVGDSFVALPLAGPTVSRPGFLPAGGLLAEQPPPGSKASGELAGGGSWDRPGKSGVDSRIDPESAAARTAAVRPIGPPRPTLVVAGCDPALPLLT